MKTIKIKKLNEIIYHETLDNGLNIYFYKTPGFQKKMAYFQTKYGSLYNDFIPINASEMKSFPLGIAHFLEHKLFESNDNESVFQKFEKNGAGVNAATTYDKTYYYFFGADHFYENLEILINMVQNPYFTDENVEKEKGIIGQELDMYSNNPSQVLLQKLYYNAIVNHPLKYDVGGTKEEVNKITKEDLYECYNTFYHPSNMILVIMGDLDEHEVFEFVRKNQAEKHFEKSKEIKLKKYEEPEKVVKKEETIYHNVVSPKIGYAYKFILPKLDDKKSFLRESYIQLFLATKFGSTTEFTEDLIKKKLVKSYFYYDYVFKDNIAIIFFAGDILDDEAVNDLIEEKLHDFSDLKEVFELYKKAYLSSYVKMFEVPDSVLNHIRIYVNRYGYVFDDLYELVEGISYDEYLKYVQSLKFNQKTKVTVLGKEE